MKFEPLVSVIIPTYNRTNFLKFAIKSVLKQTYKRFEIIVVDDGSEEDIYSTIQTINSQKIKYFRIKHQGLPAIARNFGIRKSKGKYIAFLDSDDYWYPNKLEYQIKLINSKIYKDIYCVVSNGFTFPGMPKKMVKSIIKNKKRISISFLLDRAIIINSSAIFKKKIIERIGFLSEEKKLRGVEDYEYWLRILFYFDKSILFTQKVLIGYRIHDGSITSKLKNVFNNSNILIFQKYVPKTKDLFLRYNFYKYFKKKEFLKQILKGEKLFSIFREKHFLFKDKFLIFIEIFIFLIKNHLLIKIYRTNKYSSI